MKNKRCKAQRSKLPGVGIFVSMFLVLSLLTGAAMPQGAGGAGAMAASGPAASWAMPEGTPESVKARLAEAKASFDEAMMKFEEGRSEAEALAENDEDDADGTDDTDDVIDNDGVLDSVDDSGGAVDDVGDAVDDVGGALFDTDTVGEADDAIDEADDADTVLDEVDDADNTLGEADGIDDVEDGSGAADEVYQDNGDAADADGPGGIDETDIGKIKSIGIDEVARICDLGEIEGLSGMYGEGDALNGGGSGTSPSGPGISAMSKKTPKAQ